MSSDRENVRPKLWKGPGDCMAMLLHAELSCDLPAGHEGDHFDAEYGLSFKAPVPAGPARSPGSQGAVGLMQVIPRKYG